MGAFVDGDTHAKSWMAGSPKGQERTEGAQMEGSHPSPSIGVQAPTHTPHE